MLFVFEIISPKIYFIWINCLYIYIFHDLGTIA